MKDQKPPVQDETSAEEALLIALRSAAIIFGGSDKLADKLEAFRHIAAGVEGFLHRQPEFASLINPVNQLHAFMQDLCDGNEPHYLPKNMTGRPAKSNALSGQVIVAVILDLLVAANVPVLQAADTAARIAGKAKIPAPGTKTINPQTPADSFTGLRKKLRSKSKEDTKEGMEFWKIRDAALLHCNRNPAAAASALEENVLRYIGGHILHS